MTVGERLRAARMKHNLTQKDVAKMVGVHQTLYGDWERDERKIPVNRMRQLSEVLYVKESWLRGGAASPREKRRPPA